jgi:hypothetical protein
MHVMQSGTPHNKTKTRLPGATTIVLNLFVLSCITLGLGG